MKKQTSRSHLTLYVPNEPMYPGAADHRYFAEKAVNIITGVVSGMGFLSAMLFLMTL